MSAPSRYGATAAEVEALVAELGQPAYRARQLLHALWQERAPLEDATALPRALREALAMRLPLALRAVAEATGDDETTTKWLWRAGPDGAQVETVLMRSPSRATVCVSSQAGCAMGCTFCATGQAGFERHLDAGEIVEQVVRAHQASPQPVTNVVFMGMGEPLANYDEMWRAVTRLHDDLGISARRIVVSTVGVVPGMRRLARESLPVTLAVSLHAPDDELRSRLVPLNVRYPIAEVLDAAEEVAHAHGRRVSFEYACIAGVNDQLHHADALAARLRPLGALGAHVNLIPLNPTAEFAGHAPDPTRLRVFASRLRDAGVNATVRRNRGTDIDGACGQLRARVAAPTARVPDPDPGAARMG